MHLHNNNSLTIAAKTNKQKQKTDSAAYKYVCLLLDQLEPSTVNVLMTQIHIKTIYWLASQ